MGSSILLKHNSGKAKRHCWILTFAKQSQSLLSYSIDVKHALYKDLQTGIICSTEGLNYTAAPSTFPASYYFAPLSIFKFHSDLSTVFIIVVSLELVKIHPASEIIQT